jgi:hypothetical protein
VGKVCVDTAASPVQRSEASAPLAGSGSEAGASVLPKSDQRPPQLCHGLIESWERFRGQECPRHTVKFEVDESLP